jgi:hypothetical protein
MPYFRASGESISAIEERAMTGYFKMKADYLIDEAIEWIIRNPKQAKKEEIVRSYINSKFFTWFTKLLKVYLVVVFV